MAHVKEEINWQKLSQTLELLDKGFKSNWRMEVDFANQNVSWKLKKTIGQQLKDIRKIMDKQNGNVNKEEEITKSNQIEILKLPRTIPEMKKTIRKVQGRFD